MNEQNPKEEPLDLSKFDGHTTNHLGKCGICYAVRGWERIVSYTFAEHWDSSADDKESIARAYADGYLFAAAPLLLAEVKKLRAENAQLLKEVAPLREAIAIAMANPVIVDLKRKTE